MEPTSETGQTQVEQSQVLDPLTQAAEATVQSAGTLPRRGILAGLAVLAGTWFGFGAGKEPSTVAAPGVSPDLKMIPELAEKKIETDEEIGKEDNTSVKVELPVIPTQSTEAIMLKQEEKEEQKLQRIRELRDFSQIVRQMVNPEAFTKYYRQFAADMGNHERMEQLVSAGNFLVKEKVENGRKTTSLGLIDGQDRKKAIFLTISEDPTGLQTRTLELTPLASFDEGEKQKVLEQTAIASQELTGITDMVSVSSDQGSVLEGKQVKDGVTRITRVNDKGFISLKEVEEPMVKAPVGQQNI